MSTDQENAGVPITQHPVSPIPAELSWDMLEAVCRALGHDPINVREIRLRAPRTVEVLVYARDERGDKFLRAHGVSLLAYSYSIEAPELEPEPVAAA